MSYNLFPLTGKTILITGASSGIGRATAVECSKLGATCIITGRNEERLSETFESLEGNGHPMFIADLSKKDELNSLISNLPCINGIVNNAGISKPLPVNFVTGSNLVIDGGITVKI